MRKIHPTSPPLFLIILLVIMSLTLTSCSSDEQGKNKRTITDNSSANSNNAPHLSIVSGSENKSLQPLIQAWADKHDVNIEISYQGSVDIYRLLQAGDNSQFDAVWPANHLWIELSDTHQLVKHEKSIMRSPIALGLKKSIAKQLGWTNQTVSVQAILAALNQSKFRLSMTSATQSNSGASAYFSFLYAMADYPDTLTKAHLDDPNVQNQVKQLLSSVNRSSGSSGWLKEAFVNNPDRFDAMFNYEAMLIEANQEFVRRGQEPLCLIYPQDGLMVADSPLAYIGNAEATEKEALFLKLQQYLLSKSVQASIESTGRRTGLLGTDVAHADPKIWNPDWCIDTQKSLAPIPTPERSVIEYALAMYQNDLRKPSLTIWVLDVSGSMYGDGITGLKQAMTTLFDSKQARQHLLQAGKNDMTYIIPFNSEVLPVWKIEGNSIETQQTALKNIQALNASGGTDLYQALKVALDILKQHDDDKTLWNYLPAIVAMTDGLSQTGHYSLFEHALKTYPFASDIPIHAIAFGSADKQQLRALTQQSIGRLFDSQGDLGKTLREAKGYN